MLLLCGVCRCNPSTCLQKTSIIIFLYYYNKILPSRIFHRSFTENFKSWDSNLLKGFSTFTSLRSNFLLVSKKTVLRAQISVSNNFGCFEKLWRSSFVLCRWKIHIMVFRWPTWIFVSNLIHFVQKHTFYSRGSEGDFQRLRVLSFDPRANFASPLMFGFFSNFS